MVRPRSCRVIYYFDTPALGRRHQSFSRVIELSLLRFICGSANGKCKRGCINFICFETFFPPVARAKHCNRQRSQAWSENMSSRRTLTWQSSLYKNLFMILQVKSAREDLLIAYATNISHQFQHEETVAGWRARFGLKNIEQTSNFNIAEISRQESICGSVNGKSKKEYSSFRSSMIFLQQCQYLKCKSRKKRHASTEKHEEDWNFNRAELSLLVLVCCTVREESKKK